MFLKLIFFNFLYTPKISSNQNKCEEEEMKMTSWKIQHILVPQVEIGGHRLCTEIRLSI